MFETFLKSKIHRATVTGADLNYEGSIAICPHLCRAAHLRPWERVEIYNIHTGDRFATYVISGRDGEVCLNGAAARLAQAGDKVIIAAYVQLSPDAAANHTPQLVLVDAANQISTSNAPNHAYTPAH
jgi:aspartate 1-decarboxylase